MWSEGCEEGLLIDGLNQTSRAEIHLIKGFESETWHCSQSMLHTVVPTAQDESCTTMREFGNAGYRKTS